MRAEMDNTRLIVIAGPTAIGKTAISIELAKQIDGEIVSADSMQVYKHMDIGTAKPTISERQAVVHYLIDEVEPYEEFNVFKYVNLAHKYIDIINKKGKIPIMVGGTGLYINSAIDNVNFSETMQDNEYRNELLLLANKNGNEYIHEMLRKVDAKAAQRLHPNDLRRVIRALEVYHTTGLSLSMLNNNAGCHNSPYRTFMFALDMDRAELYARIDKRVDNMLEKGLEDEVKSLLHMGVNREMTSMQGIGYKQYASYLAGEMTFDETVETIKRDSRRYAKRQFTWFRRDMRINWISITPYSDIKNIAANCKKYIES